MRRAAKVDKNQPLIVNTLRLMGAVVLITSQLKNCFDVLVMYGGRTMLVEIKDGALPPSQRKLTDGEANVKRKVEAVGVTYHIVETVDDAVALLAV